MNAAALSGELHILQRPYTAVGFGDILHAKQWHCAVGHRLPPPRHSATGGHATRGAQFFEL
jgi:hypothetical protein